MVSVGCDWMNSLCIMVVETSLGGWKICRMPISMKPYVIPVKYDKCRFCAFRLFHIFISLKLFKLLMASPLAELLCVH